MIQVQKIACSNHAGFVMSFKAVCSDGGSNDTDNYPINQTRVIDLAETALPEGTEVWPEVHPVFGPSRQSEPAHVQFALNGQTATYVVRSTALTYSVELVGG